MKRTVLLAVAATASMTTVAAAATTTTHVGTDHKHAVSFSLVARQLTITLDPVAGAPNPLATTLPGTVLDIACNGLAKNGKRKLGKSLQYTWPTGATSTTVKLSNDVSTAMRWCLMERHDNGLDIGLSESMKLVRTKATPTPKPGVTPTPKPTPTPTPAPYSPSK